MTLLAPNIRIGQKPKYNKKTKYKPVCFKITKTQYTIIQEFLEEELFYSMSEFVRQASYYFLFLEKEEIMNYYFNNINYFYGYNTFRMNFEGSKVKRGISVKMPLGYYKLLEKKVKKMGITMSLFLRIAISNLIRNFTEKETTLFKE